MKLLALILLFFIASPAAEKNAPVSKVDLKRFSGKWYSLYSIPTMFDKGSRETITTYTLNKQGYIDVKTTCKKKDSNSIQSVSSKMFPEERGPGGELKVQFVWPIKVDYWIIELAEDYSYVVVGHPDHRFLFIMSRDKKMSSALYQQIKERCKAKGYDVSRLISQGHVS